MEVKNNWNDNDFEDMSWHDCYVYEISFPDENQKLRLDIDYIFDWVLERDSNMYRFWVSPSQLTFLNVLYLKLHLDFQNTVGLTIEKIKRGNPRKLHATTKPIWDYEIMTDKGLITFQSSGFLQEVKAQPILSEYQTLYRNSS